MLLLKILRFLPSWSRTAFASRRKDLGVENSPCLLARGRLTSEIHTKGGDRFLRPLSGAERDRCLGFPSGASCLPDDGKEGFSWESLETTGNAFAVPIIAHILELVAAFLLRADAPLPELVSGFPGVCSKEEALLSLTASDVAAASGNNCRRSNKSSSVEP